MPNEEKRTFKVKATPAIFARVGDRVTLDFKDYVRIFKQPTKDDPGVLEHELSLTVDQAYGLKLDGYEVPGVDAWIRENAAKSMTTTATTVTVASDDSAAKK
jgi:hypothetical protein